MGVGGSAELFTGMGGVYLKLRSIPLKVCWSHWRKDEVEAQRRFRPSADVDKFSYLYSSVWEFVGSILHHAPTSNKLQAHRSSGWAAHTQTAAGQFKLCSDNTNL